MQQRQGKSDMIDVTVKGAGIFGLSCAFTCAKRGARVRVIDPKGPGTGASGGIVGALAPHTPENWNAKKQFQFDSLLLAREFWPEVADLAGIDPGYCRSGRLQPLADAKAVDLAKARAQTANELWQGQANWRVMRMDDRDWGPQSPTGLWIQDTLSAHIHPRRAVQALVAACHALRVEIVADADNQGLVIEATGATGLDRLSARRGRLVGAGIKGQAALFDFDAGGAAPQLFVETLHIIPHSDGTVAVGSTTEREFDDATGTDDQLETLIEKARALLPILADAPVMERWAGLRPRARSRAPMLGPDPDYAGVFIANGGFKIGFGMAPKVGQVMADLVLENRDAVPDGFRVADNW